MNPFAGVATGVGSWPGTDPLEAATVVLGELGQLPHLPELPARGLGADMVGRTAALLDGIPLDHSTTGYRIDGADGAVARRARDFLRHDLDAFEEAWERGGHQGSGTPVKVQLVGPLTLAAQLELRGGHRTLTDKGALRDVADALGEAARDHATAVARRLGTQVLVQLDEPLLGAVLAGALRGTSIMQPVSALPEPEALALLDKVVGVCGVPALVHSCADDVPLGTLRRSAASAVGFDVARVAGTAALDGVGELIDNGKVVVLGVVPARAPAGRLDVDAPGRAARELVARLGFGRGVSSTTVAVTPVCGLAGAGQGWARTALRLCERARRSLADTG